MNRYQIRLSRDTILFSSGLLGVLHETLVVDVERPSLLILFAGMMGLPAIIRTDEKRKADKDGK